MGRWPIRFLASVSLVAALLPVPFAVGADEKQEAATKEGQAAKNRLEFLTSYADTHSFTRGEEAGTGSKSGALDRSKTPVLRWSNPVRDFISDGAMFLILDGERPKGVFTLWMRGREGSLESGDLFRELVSLSGERLTCRRGETLVWSPPAGALVEKSLEGAPAPAEKPETRLVQFRQQARRFQATYKKGDSSSVLRMLPQPLYRFRDEDAGILDGAVFAFVESNDPEVVLMLEVLSGPEPRWRYSFGRLTSHPVTARLDDVPVFEASGYWTRGPDNPYSEVMFTRYTLPQ